MKNIHGLGRHIPNAVQREVRRRSKNACVICRSIVQTFEHISPRFRDAHSHDPDKICLLCPVHQSDSTSGRLSEQQILGAYLNVQNNPDIKPPFYQYNMQGHLDITLGNSAFSNMSKTANIIQYDDSVLLRATYVEDDIFGGIRASISGVLNDAQGNRVIEINDNEFSIVAHNVDCTMVSDTLTIRSDQNNIVATIQFIPPNAIHIDRLRMKYKDIIVELVNGFGVTFPTLSGQRHKVMLTGSRSTGATSALRYSSDRFLWMQRRDFTIVGGEGISLPASGVTLSSGGSMTLEGIEIY